MLSDQTEMLSFYQDGEKLYLDIKFKDPNKKCRGIFTREKTVCFVDIEACDKRFEPVELKNFSVGDQLVIKGMKGILGGYKLKGMIIIDEDEKS